MYAVVLWWSFSGFGRGGDRLAEYSAYMAGPDDSLPGTAEVLGEYEAREAAWAALPAAEAEAIRRTLAVAAEYDAGRGAGR